LDDLLPGTVFLTDCFSSKFDCFPAFNDGEETFRFSSLVTDV